MKEKKTEWHERLLTFLKAQVEAEEQEKHEFACPLCGGRASWGRAPNNNHLHTGCMDCGITIME